MRAARMPASQTTIAEQKVILDLIYNSPTWLWGTIVILLITGVSCGGLALFHWMVHLELRRSHNELTGFTVAVISVTYAVLLAFIAIATWEFFTEAAQMVDNEADYVGSIYRDTQGLSANVGEDIRVDARDYIKTVIDKEWPIQQAGRTPSAGWKPLREIHSDIVTMRPTTLGEAVIQAELLKTLNGLYRARASRLAAAEGACLRAGEDASSGHCGERSDEGPALFVRVQSACPQRPGRQTNASWSAASSPRGRDAVATKKQQRLLDRMFSRLFLSARQIGSLDSLFGLRGPVLDRSFGPRVPPG